MKIRKMLSYVIISAVMLMTVSVPGAVSAVGYDSYAPMPKTELRGDISGDNIINIYDIIEIAKSLIGIRKFTYEEKKIADFNEDGKVNLYDAIDIAEYLLSVMNNISDSPETVNSVYCTHIFDHIKNIDDLRKHYNAEDVKAKGIPLYGYPDYDYFEDTLRLICEEKKIEFEEVRNKLDAEYEEAESFQYEVLDTIFTLKTLPIIEGETVGIEYTVYEGNPWTVCEVLVSETYSYIKDYIINKGDRVKIAMPGGYMPVREYIELNPDSEIFSGWKEKEINSTVIYEDGSNQKEPKIGDKFTYILSDSDYIPDFPIKNCLTRFGFNDAAQFTREGDTFTSCNSNLKELYFTSEQIAEFNFHNIFSDPDSGRSIGIRNESFLMAGQFDCYSIDENGRIGFLGTEFPDDGFYPFCNEKNYNITWTDDSVIIEYRFDYGSDIFKTAEYAFPK